MWPALFISYTVVLLLGLLFAGAFGWHWSFIVGVGLIVATLVMLLRDTWSAEHHLT